MLHLFRKSFEIKTNLVEKVSFLFFISNSMRNIHNRIASFIQKNNFFYHFKNFHIKKKTIYSIGSILIQICCII